MSSRISASDPRIPSVVGPPGDTHDPHYRPQPRHRLQHPRHPPRLQPGRPPGRAGAAHPHLGHLCLPRCGLRRALLCGPGAGLLLHPHRQPHAGAARRAAGGAGRGRGRRGVRLGHGRHHRHVVVHAGAGRRDPGRPHAVRLHLLVFAPWPGPLWRDGAPCGHDRPRPRGRGADRQDPRAVPRNPRQPQHAPGGHRCRVGPGPRPGRQGGGGQHLLHALPAAALAAGCGCERALHDQVPRRPWRSDRRRGRVCRCRAGPARAPVRPERHDWRGDVGTRRPPGDARPENPGAAHGPPLPERAEGGRIHRRPPGCGGRALPRPAQLCAARAGPAADAPDGRDDRF